MDSAVFVRSGRRDRSENLNAEDDNPGGLLCDTDWTKKCIHEIKRPFSSSNVVCSSRTNSEEDIASKRLLIDQTLNGINFEQPESYSP